MKKSFFQFGFFLLLLYLSSCNNKNTSSSTQDKTVTAFDLKSVFINGDSLHYIDIGKGDPVVLVHGSFGDYREWSAQMDTFANKYRVIAYSRRFAYPNKQIINDSADYSATAHSKDLAEFLKALNLEPVHLVGHSFGAFTALLATMDHPELVRSLTLGEPPVVSLLQNVPGGDTLINNLNATIVPVAEAYKNNDHERAASKFIALAMDDSSYFSRLPQRDRAIMLDNSLEIRGTLFGKNAFHPVSCDSLKELKVPVLLLKGEISPLWIRSIIDELASCISNNEKAILPNTSHGLNYENPSDFNKVVLGFIDKH